MPDDGGPNEGGSNAPVPRPIKTDELDWRARALAAEAKASEFAARISALEKEAVELRSALATSDRRRELDRLLASAGAIDAEAAAVLAEAAMNTKQGADPAWAVGELRRLKPYLFPPTGTKPRASAMSGAVEPHTDAELARAAEEARAAGDRAAILRYLRMKRAS